MLGLHAGDWDEMFFHVVGKDIIWFVEKNKPGREWRAKKWDRVPISWEVVTVGQETDYGYISGDNIREKWFQKNLFFRSILQIFGWLGCEEFKKNED